MDLAALGIKIDNSQVTAADASIQKLGATGDAVANRLRAVFAAATAAFGVHALIHRFTEETSAAQAAQAQLAAAVRSTGGVAGFTVAQLQRMATELQRVTAFSDEAVQGAQSILLTFRQIRGDQFRDATVAVTDLAARMGGDLRSAALQLGKALQDPTEGLTALRRQGIIFSASQQEMIKHLTDTGRLVEAQTIILRELQTQFGGSAAAARTTLGGALTGLRNDFGDLFEATAKETGALVELINTLAAVARWVNDSRETFKSFAIAVAGVTTAMIALAAVAGGTLTSALGRLLVSVGQASLGVGYLQAAIVGFGTAGAAAIAAIPIAALTGSFALLVAAIRNARLEVSLFNEANEGAARDARVLQAFAFRRQFGETKGQQFFPDVFSQPSPNGPVAEATQTELDRAKAARQAIEALRQEADILGLTTEAARRYKVENLNLDDAGRQLTATERGLALAQVERITAKERLIALDAQAQASAQVAAEGAAAAEAQHLAELDAARSSEQAYADAVNRIAVSLFDSVAALEADTDALKRQAAVQRGARAVREALEVQLAGERTVREAVNTAAAQGVHLTEEETRALREAAEARERANQALQSGSPGAALTNAKALAQTIMQGVQGTLQLAEAVGAVDAAFAKTVTTIAQVVTSVNVLAKAIAAASAGDIISAGLSVAGGIASLFGGGGPSPEEQKRLEVQRQNTAAIRELTKRFGEFGLAITGSAFAAGQKATGALLAAPASALTSNSIFPQVLDLKNVRAILSAAGAENLAQLQDFAQSLGITLDTSSVNAFTDSLKQLDAAIKATQLTQFARTFAGAMQALQAQFRVFNITNPVKQLEALLKVLDNPSFGSPALADAAKGLDLTSQAGQDQLQKNLESLFRDVKAGRLTPEQLGGLTPQEFLDQLTGLAETIRQAKEAELQRQRGLEDLEVRRLRATGQGQSADVLAAQLQRQREYRDAVLAGADALTLATLRETQRAEAVQRTEDRQREIQRTRQDLTLRFLRATGQDTRADALAFRLKQQREYEDAVRAGTDAVTLAKLAEVQRAEAIQQTTDAMQGTIDLLRDFQRDLRLDTQLTTLSPIQQAQEAQRRYQEVLARAQAGDQAAAAQLPEAARAFLTASRAVNASGPAYAADFARVLRETDAIARMFERQRDTQLEALTAQKSTAANTTKMVDTLENLVAAQAVTTQALIDKLEEARAAAAADALAMKRAIEGLAL